MFEASATVVRKSDSAGLLKILRTRWVLPGTHKPGGRFSIRFNRTGVWRRASGRAGPLQSKLWPWRFWNRSRRGFRAAGQRNRRVVV